MKPTVEAMLAHPGTEKDLGRSNTVGEEKYDGTRIWAGKVEGEAFVINRRNIDYTDRLLDVIEALDGIPSEDFILDGEACVYENGRSILEYSQKRCSTQDNPSWRQTSPRLQHSQADWQLSGSEVSSPCFSSCYSIPCSRV